MEEDRLRFLDIYPLILPTEALEADTYFFVEKNHAR